MVGPHSASQHNTVCHVDGEAPGLVVETSKHGDYRTSSCVSSPVSCLVDNTHSAPQAEEVLTLRVFAPFPFFLPKMHNPHKTKTSCVHLPICSDQTAAFLLFRPRGWTSEKNEMNKKVFGQCAVDIVTFSNGNPEMFTCMRLAGPVQFVSKNVFRNGPGKKGGHHGGGARQQHSISGEMLYAIRNDLIIVISHQ
ncbi:hypothetical protein OUZ56_002869 [Daphnia magna]|uniref:Uncharacterized protein n=1 Tax=Daphnia magna TaxID=35525 RepID=A0ABR0A711_9CRUS|nr:hypothetical protein OUZ56_002869 [Daphnia magna]